MLSLLVSRSSRHTGCLFALLSTSLFWAACSGEEPEQPTCTADSECADNEICDASGSCVVEQGLCSSSADCEEGKFCVPRDEMGGKTICDRVLRCDEVDAADVSALCRQNNGLMGNEQFECDVSIPDAPTCIRLDKPMMDMGSDMIDMPEDMPEDMPDMPPEEVVCQTSQDCTRRGEYCLGGIPTTCGVPSSCDQVIQVDRTQFCSDQSDEEIATCRSTIMGRYVCQNSTIIEDVYWYKLEDTTLDPASCEQSAPGSDIMGVRLRGESGDILGWAYVNQAAFGSSGMVTNDYYLPVRFDGTAHGFEDLSCPEDGMRMDEMMPPPLSLGCGGWMIFQFLDPQGNPIEIFNNMEIDVLEYGATCGDTFDDRYQLYFCGDSFTAERGDDESCVYREGEESEGTTTYDLSPMSD